MLSSSGKEKGPGGERALGAVGGSHIVYLDSLVLGMHLGNIVLNQTDSTTGSELTYVIGTLGKSIHLVT